MGTHESDSNGTRSGPDWYRDTLARSVLLFLLLAISVITLRKWGDLTVDCGREMYVPTVLSQGKRLYLEVFYPYGPLIPYWHALLFRLFGVHLWILQAAGLAIAGATTLITYSLSRFFLPLTLSFVASFAVVVQAFQLHLFNYIQPYSYPAAYGSMMFVVLTWLVVKHGLSEKPWAIFAAGSLAGLEAITKVEFGFGAYLLLGGVIFLRAARSRSFQSFCKDIALCTPGVLLFCGTYGWYVRTTSLEFMFGQNIPVLPDSYFVRTFGKQWAATVGFTTSPALLAKTFGVGLLGITVLVATVWYASISRVKAVIVAGFAAAACALNLGVNYAEKVRYHPVPKAVGMIGPLLYFNPGMVFVVAVFTVAALVRWRRTRSEVEESTLLLLFGGALAIGSRSLVRIEPSGYSMFYDVIPFIAYLVVLWRLAIRLGIASFVRLWTWTSLFWCCGLISLVAVEYPLHRRTFQISSPRGSIYTDPWKGRAFQSALTFLEGAKARSEMFVVWPEEAAFYYFSGETAPNRWYMLTPGVLPPGELTEQYLDDLDRHQVKYVALSNEAKPEYGATIFGIDYNQAPYDWLQRKFRVVQTFGDYQRVSSPPHWAVQIWERK